MKDGGDVFYTGIFLRIRIRLRSSVSLLYPFPDKRAPVTGISAGPVKPYKGQIGRYRD